MIRLPCVNGKFYNNNSKDLKEQIKSFNTCIDIENIDILGCISPHAGYVYSGDISANVLAYTKDVDIYIILGPAHSNNYGRSFSIMLNGIWQTPLGDVQIENDLAHQFVSEIDFVEENFDAHMYEHSIEVQLPFLQYFNKKFTFIPIIISDSNLERLQYFGKKLAELVRKYEQETGKKICIISSSDMNHYESQEITEKKDNIAIKSILNFDETSLASNVNKHEITMCGINPSIILITAMKELGVRKSKLLKYHTSGEISGDYSQVVGYAGIIFY